MATDTAVGYIFQTNAGTADRSQFQQLVTIDAPRRGDVIDHCVGRQGLYFLTQELAYGKTTYYVHIQPTPGGTTDVKYDRARKMEYTWKSKEYLMPGRTTWGAAKVVHCDGCVKFRLYIDGCCAFETAVRDSQPFRIPPLAGTVAEIELIGTAQVKEVHIASTMRELTSNG